MRAQKLTSEQRREMLAEYRAGVKLEAIGAKYGVSYTYPVILAKRRGFGKRHRRSKLLISVYKRILESKCNGYSTRKIAEAWQVSERHVQRIIQEMSNETD